MTMQHIPVMLAEVIESLAVRQNGIYVDGTFGAGGYTSAILNADPSVTVYAIDRDPEAIARAHDLAKKFKNRLIPVHAKFSEARQALKAHGVSAVDGFVLDLGVSSQQLETAERGFSFRLDGPLDMRMGQDGQTAADVVNSFSEKDISDILFRLGDEKNSRRIAHAIVTARAVQKIATTKDLQKIIHSIMPRHPSDKIDPATRSFQALRIFVNDELGEIDRVLAEAECLLKEEGRLVVVSFHSLEDSRVKAFFKTRSGNVPNPSRFLPDAVTPPPPSFSVPEKSGLKPGDEEIKANPRSRSAHLRYGIRTAAKAFTAEVAA